MDKVIINNKEYEVKLTLADIEKLNRKYKFEKLETMSLLESNKFLSSMLWFALKRRWFLKPFVFKSIMKRNISMAELAEIAKKITGWLYGEDRDRPNPPLQK